MIKLSVIVTIYNAEKTLSTCLESIVNQTYENLEIICVNDGSTDGSLNICNHFQQQDARIVILDEPHRGISSTRNAGLLRAVGEYFTFVDSDDWLEPHAYNTMLLAAQKRDADMVVCNFSKDRSGNIEKMVNRFAIPEVIDTKEELITYEFYRENYRGFSASVCNKLFKRDIIDKNNFTFDPSVTRGEDVLFCVLFALHAKTTVYVNAHFYHYVQREDSFTHTHTKSNFKNLAGSLNAYAKSIKALEDNSVKREVISYLKCFYVYHASVLYEIALAENLLSEQTKLKSEMRRYLKEYKKQNEAFPERLARIDDLIGA